MALDPNLEPSPSGKDSPSQRFETLAERLNSVRQRRFVGREAECAIFKAALSTAGSPFAVLYLHGPGGVGKTSVLTEFQQIAAREPQHVPILRVDARSFEVSPEGFWRGLALGFGIEAASLEEVLEHLNSCGQRPVPLRSVLMIDTFERCAPYEDWLREHFLPRLGSSVLVVLSGRLGLSLAWRSEPGWADLVRVVQLRNLSPDEGREYLSRRGVPDAQHDSALAFTHSHPLALALVADTFNQRGTRQHGLDDQLAFEPDLVKTLLERFLDQVPGPAHRVALEACAFMRFTTEAPLAFMLGQPEVRELFDWLRDLSFVETGPLGLFPHDLAREAIQNDLRWRNPDWSAELHRRARAFYMQRLQQARGFEQQRILIDNIFLYREHPMVKPYFSWDDLRDAFRETARPKDIPVLIEMIRQRQGPTEAQLAEHWFKRQPHNLSLYRDVNGAPAGLLFQLDLHAATAEDIEIDAFAQTVWAFTQRNAPPRDGEAVILFRFWLDLDGFQNVSSVQSLIFVNVTQQYISTPRLAWSFLPCFDMEFWAPTQTHYKHVAVPFEHAVADFPGGARSVGAFGHDWRALNVAAWFDAIPQRGVAPKPAATQRPSNLNATMVVLSKPAFSDAVRAALREYIRPIALARNPLLRSRLISERAGDAPTDAQSLRRVVLEAASTLSLNPRDEKLFRALEATYFEPAMTQDLAAERLDLPSSTFRRHLKSSIERLTEILWTWELHE